MIIYVYFDMDGVSAVWEGGKKRSHKRRFFLHRKLQKNVRDAMIILVERGYIIKNLTFYLLFILITAPYCTLFAQV